MPLPRVCAGDHHLQPPLQRREGGEVTQRGGGQRGVPSLFVDTRTLSDVLPSRQLPQHDRSHRHHQPMGAAHFLSDDRPLRAAVAGATPASQARIQWRGEWLQRLIAKVQCVPTHFKRHDRQNLRHRNRMPFPGHFGPPPPHRDSASSALQRPGLPANVTCLNG